MSVDHTDRERYMPPTLKELTLEQATQLLADQAHLLELLDQEQKERIQFLGAE